MNSFSGEQLRALRKEAGLSQLELSKRLGLSRETISAIENEKPGTINELPVSIIKRWWKICKGRVTAPRRKSFKDYLQSFFNVQ